MHHTSLFLTRFQAPSQLLRALVSHLLSLQAWNLQQDHLRGRFEQQPRWPPLSPVLRLVERCLWLDRTMMMPLATFFNRIVDNWQTADRVGGEKARRKTLPAASATPPTKALGSSLQQAGNRLAWQLLREPLLLRLQGAMTSRRCGISGRNLRSADARPASFARFLQTCEPSHSNVDRTMFVVGCCIQIVK